MKYILTDTHDAAYNLSLEEYIFKNLPLENGEEYVYLWVNDRSVIIGKNQNAYAEINKKYIDDNNIAVCRRITGGGAVYHDLGNLNFSFVTKDNGTGKIDFKEYYIPIVNALRSIGLPAELSGRNDITVDDKKCVGASQSVWKGRVLSNGCILFDVQMENLASALNVRPEKLKSKGVASVRARVTNVKPYLKEEKTVEDFLQALLREIFKDKGEEPVQYHLTEEDRKGIEEIRKNRFGNDEWNYGRSPVGSFQNGIKFPCGWIEMTFDVKNNHLENVKILGDFFGVKEVSDLEQLLEGVKYTREELVNVLKDQPLQDYFGDVSPDDVADILLNL